MKAIVLKSVFVMTFGAMSFTTAHAEHQGTFIYGEDEHTLLVSTLNQDGKTLTPCIKYEYKRNTDGAITEKKSIPLGSILPAMAASLLANGRRRSQHYHPDLCRMEQKEEEFYRERTAIYLLFRLERYLIRSHSHNERNTIYLHDLLTTDLIHT